jgi:hypothetical protein
MNLDNDRLHNLLTAALLHNISILNMPNYFQVANPNDMAPERRKHYFYYFGRALRILKKAKPLSRSVEIIEQIWEHADGTGFPHGTPGMRISDEAQILAIANLYVKNVYSLNEKEFTNLMKEKKVQQSPETTVKKHKAAIDLIRRNSYWFRKSVSDVFLSLADKMESNAFTAPSRALIIDIQELISADNQKTKNEFIEIDFYDKDLMLDWETAEGHKVYVKSKEINIPDLKHGMILSKDLTSDGGAIVVKANTEIKEAEFKNIWQMISKDMLHGTTEIYIPFEH